MKLSKKPTQTDISPRINRQTYIYSWLLIQLLLVVPLFMTYGLPTIESSFGTQLDLNHGVTQVFFVSLLILTLAAYIWGQFVIAIYRLHDVGHSALWSLLILINPANAVLTIFLMCAKGTGKKNEYGPDPKGWQYRKVFRISKK